MVAGELDAITTNDTEAENSVEKLTDKFTVAPTSSTLGMKDFQKMRSKAQPDFLSMIAAKTNFLQPILKESIQFRGQQKCAADDQEESVKTYVLRNLGSIEGKERVESQKESNLVEETSTSKHQHSESSISKRKRFSSENVLPDRTTALKKKKLFEGLTLQLEEQEGIMQNDEIPRAESANKDRHSTDEKMIKTEVIESESSVSKNMDEDKKSASITDSLLIDKGSFGRDFETMTVRDYVMKHLRAVLKNGGAASEGYTRSHKVRFLSKPILGFE